MAINKNHEFEDLDGIKCAVVEKNAVKERVDFLKQLLEFNKYTVVLQASPPPKVVPAPVTETSADTIIQIAVAAPETFTVGVTDVMFNAINAIFGRLLKTPDGHIVTLAYWNQKERVAKDEIPYFENKV